MKYYRLWSNIAAGQQRSVQFILREALVGCGAFDISVRNAGRAHRFSKCDYCEHNRNHDGASFAASNAFARATLPTIVSDECSSAQRVSRSVSCSQMQRLSLFHRGAEQNPRIFMATLVGLRQTATGTRARVVWTFGVRVLSPRQIEQPGRDIASTSTPDGMAKCLSQLRILGGITAVIMEPGRAARAHWRVGHTNFRAFTIIAATDGYATVDITTINAGEQDIDSGSVATNTTST